MLDPFYELDPVPLILMPSFTEKVKKIDKITNMKKVQTKYFAINVCFYASLKEVVASIPCDFQLLNAFQNRGENVFVC